MPKPTTPSTENKPRVISPEIAALRAEHSAKVKALRDKETSAKTLLRITEDLLPKLTDEDQKELCRILSGMPKTDAIKPAN